MTTKSLIVSGGKSELLIAIVEALGGASPQSGDTESCLAAIANAIQTFTATQSADLVSAPATAVAQSFSRYMISSAAEASPGSGDIFMTGIIIPGNTIVNAINFITGSTPGVAMLHQWGGLASAAYSVLGVSADGTSAAIGANAVLTFTLGTPFTTPSGPPALYLAFGMIAVTTTVPTFEGTTTVAEAMTVPPILNGTSNTTQTTPPALAATLTTPTPSATAIYAYAT